MDVIRPLNRHRNPDKALRLLVADCESAVAEIVATGLEVCCDAAVIRADSGVLAAQALQTEHIDLAIIDTSLPDISGFELAESVADRNVPALLISAHPRDQELLARHGYPHLSKPFRLTALVGAVTTALRNVKENVANLHRAHAVLHGTDHCRHHGFYSATGKQISRRRERYLIKGLATHWASQGLPARARSALAYARCGTVEQVRSLGRAYFAALENCGAVTLGQIEHAVGGWREGESEIRPRMAASMAEPDIPGILAELDMVTE